MLFRSNEERLGVAHPLAQGFRIYQELANIQIEEGIARPRKLTLGERDALAERLLSGEDLTFGKIRKALDIGGAAKINLDDGKRDRLKGDASAARLGGKKGALARVWPDLTADKRAEVVARLLDEPDEAVRVRERGVVVARQVRPPGFVSPKLKYLGSLVIST